MSRTSDNQRGKVTCQLDNFAMDPPQSRYLIKSVVRASKVLSAFQSPGEVLRLRDVAERTGFNRAMCFRFVYTLSKCGFLEKAGENQYRLISDKGPNRRFRIGYGAPEQDSSFQRAVLTGLTLAAQRESIELIVLDKRYNTKDALHKADQLVREQVDVVIEFQTDEAVAAAVASKYVEKNIPIIAIDNPHPGATYFGANNYEAGLMAGQHLGRWARAHWEGVVDQVLLLDVSKAGWVVQARLRGTLEGLKQMLDSTRQLPVTTLDGDGQFGTVWEAVRRHLRGLKGNRVLVAAANDSSALGALARVRRGRPAHPLCGGQSRCRTGGSKGIAGASYEAHWIGGILPREIWRRADPFSVGYPGAQGCTARLFYQAHADHPGKRRSFLPERPIPGWCLLMPPVGAWGNKYLYTSLQLRKH